MGPTYSPDQGHVHEAGQLPEGLRQEAGSMRINFSVWGHPSQWDSQAKASYKSLTEARNPSSAPHLQLHVSEEVLLQLLIPGGMTPHIRRLKPSITSGA